MVVDDEFWTTLRRLGRHRLPILADIDPYANTTLRGEAVDRMVRELTSALDLAQPKAVDYEAFTTLLAWGLRCRADRDLRIGFAGD